MQPLEVSCAVRRIYTSLGAKGLKTIFFSLLWSVAPTMCQAQLFATGFQNCLSNAWRFWNKILFVLRQYFSDCLCRRCVVKGCVQRNKLELKNAHHFSIFWISFITEGRGGCLYVCWVPDFSQICINLRRRDGRILDVFLVTHGRLFFGIN